MIDVGALLEKVEAAAPIDAVEAVAAALGEMVDAQRGDPPDRRLQRPGRRPADLRRTGRGRPQPRRRAGRDAAAARAPLYERCCARSRPTSQRLDDGARMIVPVTDRGDAIGLLELTCRGTPPRTRSPTSAAPRTPWPTSSSPPAGTPTSSSGASARTPFALAAEIQRRLLPGVLHLRGGAVHPRRLAGAGRLGRRGHLRLHAGPRLPAGVDHRRRRPPGGGRAAGHPARRRPPQRAPEGPRPRRAGARTPTTALAENAAAGQFVTGQLLRVDLRTGTRGDRQRRPPVPAAAARRPGGGDRAAHRAAVRRRARQVLRASRRFPLEPGDRIVLLTDGMQERNAVDLDVAAALADSADLHPREVVHELGAAVLQRDRRRPAGRRDDGLPRLVRRPAARPEHRAGRRSRPRLGARLTRAVRTAPRAGPVTFGHHAHRPGRVAFHHRTPGPRGRSRRPAGTGRRGSAGWPGRSWACPPTWRCSSATPTGAATPCRPDPDEVLSPADGVVMVAGEPQAGRGPRGRLAAGQRLPLRRRRARQPLALPRRGRRELLPQGQLPGRLPQGVRAPERAQRAVAARRRPHRRLPADRRRPGPADRHPHRPGPAAGHRRADGPDEVRLPDGRLPAAGVHRHRDARGSACAAARPSSPAGPRPAEEAADATDAAHGHRRVRPRVRPRHPPAGAGDPAQPVHARQHVLRVLRDPGVDPRATTSSPPS